MTSCAYCEEVERLLRILIARQRGVQMKEVHDMASVMRQSIAKLKQSFTDAKNELAGEVSNSQANLSKIQALTSDLRSANKEVETELGIGSNFPTSFDSGPDSNGITKGAGVKPDGVSTVGVSPEKK